MWGNIGRSRTLLRLTAAGGIIFGAEPSWSQGTAVPSRAPSPDATIIIGNPPASRPPWPLSSRIEAVGTILDASHYLAEKAKLPALAKGLDKANGVVSGIASYQEGYEKYHDRVIATGRGILSWAAAGTAAAAVVTACGATAGLACAVVAAAAAYDANEIVTADYDYYLADWSLEKPASEQPRMDAGRVSDSVLGDPCLDYAIIGEQAPCADGSFTPFQPPPVDMGGGLIRGGRPPEWARGFR